MMRLLNIVETGLQVGIFLAAALLPVCVMLVLIERWRGRR